MSKKVLVVTIHGMGETKPNYADKLLKKLSKGLSDEQEAKVAFRSIYYQDILQDNQNAAFQRMKTRDIDWIKLRKFVLYGFSDAAGLERALLTLKAAHTTKRNRQFETPCLKRMILSAGLCPWSS